MTNSEKVREFTELSNGKPLPNSPVPLQKENIEFITKMIIDEVLELMATKFTTEESKQLLINQINQAKCLPKLEGDEVTVISEQADAFVDIEYYIKNTACRHGINLEPYFDEAHNTNMNKRDPKTGMFLRREDGKILKPENWVGPDMKKITLNQIKNSSFTKEKNNGN